MSLFSKFTDLLKARRDEWPFIRGPYYVIDPAATVAVITLGDDKLATDLAALATRGLCMTCPLTGGRGDIEKLVHTLIGNLSIQHLICAGDGELHPAALNALQVLFSKEQNCQMALDAAGKTKMPLTPENVAALRKQVQFTDMRGCREADKIVVRIRELASSTTRSTTGFIAPDGDASTAEKRVIVADNLPHEFIADKAGYFKISVGKQRIVVEHYNNKDERQRVIEGLQARSIYLTLIRNGWVSRLDHAACLGRELTRAEVALQAGTAYAQSSTTAV